MATLTPADDLIRIPRAPHSEPPMTQAKPVASLLPQARPRLTDDETQAGRPLSVPPSEEAMPYIMVLCGPFMGRVFEITERRIVVGRGAAADITLPDNGLSRKHAKFIRYPSGVVAVCDMNSLNGTFLNGEQVHSRALKDGDKIHIGTTTVLKFGFRDTLEHQAQEQLYGAATRDQLTGMYNKSFFQEALARETAAARRHGEPLSLLLIDIDHFKEVNDQYGHSHGDSVLSRVGRLLQSAVRDGDTVGRVGGEEFAVISRSTRYAEAMALGERLRKIVEDNLHRDPGGRAPLTVSVGCATYSSQHTRAEDLYRQADEFLYRAKDSGRNCVVGAAPLAAV